MIRIDIKDLIYILPDLIELFLPGFIFIILYDFLNSKKIEISLVILWSLFISFIIKIFYSAVHSFIFVDIDVAIPIKVIVYLLTATIIPIFMTYMKNTNLADHFFKKLNYKTAHQDIFDDIIDYKDHIMMQIYLKNCNKLYIGRFVIREENGLDSWIVLEGYSQLDKNTKEVLYDPEPNGLNSTVAINLREVESLEIIYTDESKVWKRISGA